MIRRPVAAGMFYPDNPTDLNKSINELWPKLDLPPKNVLAVISPHAGYMYSGKTAAQTISSIKVPDSVIILGPNHSGLGLPAAIMNRGAWMMPGTNVPIDEELAESILKECDIIQADDRAHAREHSIEVQIPFLMKANPNIKIVPICLARSDIDGCREIGQALASVIDKAGRSVLMVASTDMTHYESQESARLKDHLAIDKILALDPENQ